MQPTVLTIDVNLAFSVGQAPSPAPPTRKQRRRAVHRTSISGLSDLQAWKYSDEDIQKADMAGLKSAVYDHFTPELIRHTPPTQVEDGVVQAPDNMEYVFRCKTHPDDHLVDLQGQAFECEQTATGLD
ncbi:hypothetical protein FRC09_020884 [Ceratobasidium sp. 395]|nr:hypothetical protein FRC09_020884 [Ceratobasidium sp. 395]